MKRILVWAMLLESFAFCGDFTLTDDWHLNELLEELELRGAVPMLRGYSPYYASDLLSVMQSTGDGFWTDRTKRLLTPFGLENQGFVLWTPGVWGYHNSEKEDFRNFGRMRFGIGGSYQNWSVCGIYRLDSGYYEDPDYYGIRWERIAGKADQVFLRWSGGDFFVQIGRDYFRTGLGMALSGEKPFERITAGFKLGERLRLIWFIGQLDEYVRYIVDSLGNVEYDEYGMSKKEIYNRYLAGHRASLSWRHFQAGFTELMLYGGVGRKIEFYYMLPLYAFHGEQLNHRWNDNTLWSLDVKLLFPPFRFRAEGILDDFQIEHEVPGDREPPLYGFAAQIDLAAMSRPIFLTLSSRYEQVQNRVFNQNLPWNRYLYENKPIGAEYGNDYDQVSVNCRAFGKFFGGDLSLYHRRKGEGRIDDPWLEPWLDDPNWSEPFPSGVIEKASGVNWYLWADGLNWELFSLSGQFSAGLGGVWESRVNADHISGEKEDFWEVRAEFEMRMWNIIF